MRRNVRGSHIAHRDRDFLPRHAIEPRERCEMHHAGVEFVRGHPVHRQAKIRGYRPEGPAAVAVRVEHPPTMENRTAPADDGHGTEALQSRRRPH